MFALQTKIVLIPLRIRSISTFILWVPLRFAVPARLNPFENQVYFYQAVACAFRGRLYRGLNPFENQVYFYNLSTLTI